MLNNITSGSQDGPVADDCLEGRQIVVMFFASNGAETAGAVTQISTLYNAIQQTPQKDEFEIVFVSNDADQASFDQVFPDERCLFMSLAGFPCPSKPLAVPF